MLHAEEAFGYLAEAEIFGQAGLARFAAGKFEHVEAVYGGQEEAVSALIAPTLGFDLDVLDFLGVGSLGFYSFLADTQGLVKVVGRDVSGCFFAELLLLLKSLHFLLPELRIQ